MALNSVSCQKAGVSLIEVLVAIGIIAMIAAIGGLAYMDYHNEARLSSLSGNASNFFKSAKVCLITRNDILKCNTKEKLGLDCDDCRVTYNAGGGHKYHWKRTIMQRSLGSCDLCVEYRFYAPNVKKRVVISCDEGWKFCVHRKHYGNSYSWVDGKWTGQPAKGHNARLPLQRCSSVGDCKTGEICHQFTGKDPGQIFDNNLGRGDVCS